MEKYCAIIPSKMKQYLKREDKVNKNKVLPEHAMLSYMFTYMFKQEY